MRRAGHDGEDSGPTPDRAVDRLLPAVYSELRRLAAHYLRGERPWHTLEPTALVHEAYARLAGVEQTWGSRTDFLRAAAGAMRRILVDHARARRAEKRGGDARRLDLDAVPALPLNRPADVLALDEALRELERQDARKSQVVELHFFGGLSYEEVAAALGISPATVDREMRFSRAWLRKELSKRSDLAT